MHMEYCSTYHYDMIFCTTEWVCFQAEFCIQVLVVISMEHILVTGQKMGTDLVRATLKNVKLPSSP